MAARITRDLERIEVARLRRDLDRLDCSYIRSIAQRANPLQCDIYFTGPIGTKYFTEVFHVLVEFPENYPMKPPTITFLHRTDLDSVDPHTGKLSMMLIDPRYWHVTNSLIDIMTCLYYMLMTEHPNDE